MVHSSSGDFAADEHHKAEGILNLGRFRIDGEPRPAYTLSLQKKTQGRETKAVWSKMVQVEANRTPSLLDLDVGPMLAAQWAQQQPDARREGSGELKCVASAAMDWCGHLPPGAAGVRLLVLTLLCWGSALGADAHDDRLEWCRLAQDFADVLTILAAQAGSYKAPDSANSDNTQGESGKRVK